MWQRPIEGTDNFEWYIGGGAHVGFWGKGEYNWNNHESHVVLGADFIIGAEYTFDDVPFVVGIDYRPAVNLIGDGHGWPDVVNLTARYIF